MSGQNTHASRGVDRLRDEMLFTVPLSPSGLFTEQLFTGDGTDEGTPERAWRIKIGKARPFRSGSRSCISGVAAV